MALTELELQTRRKAVKTGGLEKYHQKNDERGKLFCRTRIDQLLDQDGADWVEDGLLANSLSEGLPADGVVTGVGRLHGRPVAVMANDSTVKAGSWGARTVEKIIRIQELALRLQIPLVYLVDSAGARITDQIDMFPGRRHAGRIFHMQCKLSGVVPQICLLFGPSAAGGAYIPAFCDQVFMVKGNASMYLGSPRMAKMVINEDVSLEAMGGARMHCEVSGCGDLLADDEPSALQAARAYMALMPQNWRTSPTRTDGQAPAVDADTLAQVIPKNENKPFDMRRVIEGLVDDT